MKRELAYLNFYISGTYWLKNGKKLSTAWRHLEDVRIRNEGAKAQR